MPDRPPEDPTTTTLPGEFDELDWKPGRGPITPDEALGVARRLGRAAMARGRGDLSNMAPPEELPREDAARVMAAYRLPPRTLAFARARAFAEGLSLTEVIEEALDGYGHSGPGTVPVWVIPAAPTP
jgi:hypothetical protein